MILVTGGAGFIGSNLVRSLGDDQDIMVVDNFHTGDMANLKGFRGHVTVADSRDISRTNVNPDVIVHLGMYSSSPMYLANHNLVGEVVSGAISVFDLAAKCGARVVFASTSSLYNGQSLPFKENAEIYATPSDFYTEARIAVERLSELYSNRFQVASVGLRFFSVYGPGEESKGVYANMLTQFVWASRGWSDKIMGRNPTVYGDGSIERDFVHVNDVVRAIQEAMKRGSGMINVGTGTSHSFNEAMDKISTMTNEDVRKKVDFVHIPDNYLLKQVADTRKAEQELGFKAKVDLAAGLETLL